MEDAKVATLTYMHKDYTLLLMQGNTRLTQGCVDTPTITILMTTATPHLHNFEAYNL
jgi:hypothetical protein